MRVVDDLIYGLRYIKFNYRKGKMEFERAAKKDKREADENLIIAELIDNKIYTKEEIEDFKKENHEIFQGYYRNEYMYYPYHNQFESISLAVPCLIKETENKLIIYDVLTREIIAEIDKSLMEKNENKVINTLNKFQDYKVVTGNPYPVP